MSEQLWETINGKKTIKETSGQKYAREKREKETEAKNPFNAEVSVKKVGKRNKAMKDVLDSMD